MGLYLDCAQVQGHICSFMDNNLSRMDYYVIDILVLFQPQLLVSCICNDKDYLFSLIFNH